MEMLIFGHGYTASFLTRRLTGAGWTVAGTTRGDSARVEAAGAEPVIWPGNRKVLRDRIASADAILVCAAPDAAGDPVLAEFAQDLLNAEPRWVGYLSSTSVYGDHGGAWVDEDTPLAPSSARARARVAAEQAWADTARRAGWPLNILRLAGIYGPGRGPFSKLRAGTARRIVKPGQVFSRIHVEDIAGVVMAALSRALEGRAQGVEIFNLCDDDPAPPEQTIECAARMLGVPVPDTEDFATAKMTAMARSFYADSKRVRNDRARDVLRYRLRYPNLQSGLRAILQAEDDA
ncbi:SDR family oxidoreductase [Paracoccus aurantiacus]|uniref:SDR family oxidoreductase n=1 Tax=Paracoccus aurantiacus TaxID=2599412 RepID=A0A5C6S7F2_9RHOB|nr:SDR family oxidoreductase [Paracoccus aurantiacus]TXB69702.1 SDR family oxidoreductase [Paracoccus aurantiacus]